MSTTFKPMLATAFAGTLAYDDYLVSPKIDGLRCVIRNATPLSRTLKVIPNRHIQKILGHPDLENFDGELVCGSPTAVDVYRASNSGVMSRDGEPDFCFHVFDVIPEHLGMPYCERSELLEYRLSKIDPQLRRYLSSVPHLPVADDARLAQIEEQIVADGYEGCMLRRASSPYKFNRSTLKEGYLLKVKRMQTSEARILGMECLMSNQNEALRDERGHTKRSSHQENLVPIDTLGKLVVKDIETGAEFSIGVFRGHTKVQLKEIWDKQEDYIGKVCSYDFFPIGMKDLPRHPVYKGLRSMDDMTA